MNHVDDPMKPLEEVYSADLRQKKFMNNLEDNHRLLSKIVLTDKTPIEVRQLFETAKNVSWYSRFAYRFHQVSEMVAFSAPKMALKEKFKMAHPNENAPKNPHRLIEYALSKHWVFDKNFPNYKKRIKEKIRRRKEVEALRLVSGLSDPGVLLSF